MNETSPAGRWLHHTDIWAGHVPTTTHVPIGPGQIRGLLGPPRVEWGLSLLLEADRVSSQHSQALLSSCVELVQGPVALSKKHCKPGPRQLLKNLTLTFF